MKEEKEYSSPVMKVECWKCNKWYPIVRKECPNCGEVNEDHRSKQDIHREMMWD